MHVLHPFIAFLQPVLILHGVVDQSMAGVMSFAVMVLLAYHQLPFSYNLLIKGYHFVPGIQIDYSVPDIWIH